MLGRSNFFFVCSFFTLSHSDCATTIDRHIVDYSVLWFCSCEPNAELRGKWHVNLCARERAYTTKSEASGVVFFTSHNVVSINLSLRNTPDYISVFFAVIYLKTTTQNTTVTHCAWNAARMAKKKQSPFNALRSGLRTLHITRQQNKKKKIEKLHTN